MTTKRSEVGAMIDDDNPPVGGADEDMPLEDGLETDDAVDITEEVDEGDDEQVTDPVEGEALAAVKQQSAASRRIQQEITRRKALEKENNEYRQHILDMQRRDAVSKPPAIDPEEERRRLEFMDEGQRVQYLVDKGLRQHQTELNRLALQMNIRDDRSGFNTFLGENPHLKKYSASVEKEFQEALDSGQPRGRAEILTTIIGNEVIRKGSAAVSKARQTGQDNIRRQQTRPGSSRSGVTGSSTRNESAEDTLKRRLAGGEYS